MNTETQTARLLEKIERPAPIIATNSNIYDPIKNTWNEICPTCGAAGDKICPKHRIGPHAAITKCSNK